MHPGTIKRKRTPQMEGPGHAEDGPERGRPENTGDARALATNGALLTNFNWKEKRNEIERALDVPTSYFVEKTLTFEPVSEEGLPEDPLPSQPPVAPLRNELVEPLVCDLSKGEVIKSGDYTVHVQYHPRGYVYTVYVYDKDMQPVRSMVPPVRLCPIYDPTHPFIPVMGMNCWAIPQIMAFHNLRAATGSVTIHTKVSAYALWFDSGSEAAVWLSSSRYQRPPEMRGSLPPKARGVGSEASPI
ncbi:hypothetical protein FISHEDRAFT_55908 [Fistulina hepatica ATCC 64428]|uniref:Uncharacterized protein n=1 Tax=Fistulina hepatica ATCC 64428 TaxID=1128425 RepID=A0A0D7ANN4_9AGAR|nr:hypothetical protein FISHEDRAFT_55908 [Fistulina hepatica ATCC 64428]